VCSVAGSDTYSLVGASDEQLVTSATDPTTPHKLRSTSMDRIKPVECSPSLSIRQQKSHMHTHNLKQYAPLTQVQFVQFWKAIYECATNERMLDGFDVMGESNTEALFHSLASVGTLLLQLGESRCRQHTTMDEQSAKCLALADAIGSVQDDAHGQPSKNTDDNHHWLLTIEQILASVERACTV
jgi:hypothetical protein